MNEDVEYNWKVNFCIEYIKVNKKWNKDNLYMIPDVEKRDGLSDKNEIRGYCLVNTKGDNQKEAEEKAKQKIEGVIASCSVLTGLENLHVSYIVPPQVLNEKELKKKGLPVTRSVGPIVLYAEGTLTSDNLDSSFEFFQKVDALSNRDSVRLTMNWFKRGLDYREPYDRFIAFWISFNAFYNLFYKGSVDDADSYKMKTLALNLFDEAEAKQLLDDHSKIISQLIALKGRFLSLSGNTDYAYELEKRLKTGNYRSALENAIRCLYSIRKTLFHGTRGITESEKKIVEDVNPFLKQIVRRSLLKYVIGKI